MGGCLSKCWCRSIWLKWGVGAGGGLRYCRSECGCACQNIGGKAASGCEDA